jgi:hypothetical protein
MSGTKTSNGVTTHKLMLFGTAAALMFPALVPTASAEGGAIVIAQRPQPTTSSEPPSGTPTTTSMSTEEDTKHHRHRHRDRDDDKHDDKHGSTSASRGSGTSVSTTPRPTTDTRMAPSHGGRR